MMDNTIKKLPDWFKKKYKLELASYKTSKYQDGEWWIELLEKFKLFNKSKTYPKHKISEREVRELAEFMHNVYEKASQQVNWKTQEKCQVEFSELPFENRKVMMIVANLILNVIYRDCEVKKIGK